jgi:hypothetical protein
MVSCACAADRSGVDGGGGAGGAGAEVCGGGELAELPFTSPAGFFRAPTVKY